jgi:rhomboid protease GluP
MEREEHYRLQPKEMAHAYATYALVAVNVAMFFVEMTHGGSTNEPALIRLGAAQVGAVLAGEWWRLIAANFLHFGWLHITMNMLALLIFGRMLEPRLGHWRFLLVYFVAGTAAVGMALFPLNNPAQTVVGASGSIMALIGAFAATSLHGWLREGAHIARAQLWTVLSIVFLQSLFDAFTPEVSGIAHLSGALFGFSLTMLLLGWQRRQVAAM